jgi:cell division protein ZapA (FtsZ GTPase activity inhibitor)
LLTINIVIGDRTYRIKVEPKNEEAVRKVVKTINDKIAEFRSNFAGKDMQDYVAMVLVWFATIQTTSDVDAMSADLEDYLEGMEKGLDSALKN